MIVEDCIFTNLESDQVVFMGNDVLSSPEDLLPKQSTLTISNSVFTDIAYRREILSVDNQTLIVQGSTFHDIQYCGCDVESSIFFADDANLSIEDTSISNVEVVTSVVLLYGDTEFTTKRLSVSNTSIYDKESRPEDEYCEEGIIVEKVVNGGWDECLPIPTPAPSSQPSIQPSSQPSSMPSSQPSNQPSKYQKFNINKGNGKQCKRITMRKPCAR